MARARLTAHNLTMPLVVAALIAVSPSVGTTQVTTEAAATTSDFNGDSKADLAIGIPREDGPTGTSDSGVVQIIYGSNGGLAAPGNQLWSQDSAGIQDKVEANDEFGGAVAWGDFDADGFSDLAIGVPREDVGPAPSIADAGSVHVLYGTALGLSSDRAQLWTQANIAESPSEGVEPGDLFGAALATGDMNADGRDDLVVGAPLEDRAGTGEPDVGAVNLLLGSATGLTSAGSKFQISRRPAAGDQFGAALTTMEVGRGPFATESTVFTDIVVGVPADDIQLPGESRVLDAGSVEIVYGAAGGIYRAAFDPTVLVAADHDPGDRYGAALAPAGIKRLAVGQPGEDGLGDNVIDVGAVELWTFTQGTNVVATSRTAVVRQGAGLGGVPVAGTPEAGEQFGSSLASGLVGGGPSADVAIGTPFDRIKGRTQFGFTISGGSVTMIYDTTGGGFSGQNSQQWDQNAGTVLDFSESGDQFGHSLVIADFGLSSLGDLAIGVPGEDTTASGDGAVQVLYGSSATSTFQLSDASNQLWHQGSPDILDDPEAGDQFGFALAQRGQRAQLEVRCGRFIATIVGDHRDEKLGGTPGPDVIAGRRGADELVGLGGRDRLCGGRGADVVLGGRGNDLLDGGSGVDVLRGGDGVDRCVRGEDVLGCERPRRS